MLYDVFKETLLNDDSQQKNESFCLPTESLVVVLELNQSIIIYRRSRRSPLTVSSVLPVSGLHDSGTIRHSAPRRKFLFRLSVVPRTASDSRLIIKKKNLGASRAPSPKEFLLIPLPTKSPSLIIGLDPCRRSAAFRRGSAPSDEANSKLGKVIDGAGGRARRVHRSHGDFDFLSSLIRAPREGGVSLGGGVSTLDLLFLSGNSATSRK